MSRCVRLQTSPCALEKEDVNRIGKMGKWIYGSLDADVSNF